MNGKAWSLHLAEMDKEGRQLRWLNEAIGVLQTGMLCDCLFDWLVVYLKEDRRVHGSEIR